MQPEPGRHPVKAWIAATLGIALVVVAALALIGMAVFNSALTDAVLAGGTSPTADSASDASLSPPTSPSTGPSTIPSTSPSTSPSVGAPAAPATPAPVVPASASTKPPAAAAPTLSGEAAYEAQVLTLVNQERAKATCKALIADSRLAKAAKAHSADMANRKYFDHTTPEGVGFSTRITNAGYRWSAAAENIASGQKDSASVMVAWMNSPGHRANILNCNYRNLGVGLAYNATKTPYWTEDFGTPG